MVRGPKLVWAKSGKTLCGLKLVRAKSGLGQKWSLSCFCEDVAGLRAGDVFTKKHGLYCLSRPPCAFLFVVVFSVFFFLGPLSVLFPFNFIGFFHSRIVQNRKNWLESNKISMRLFLA